MSSVASNASLMTLQICLAKSPSVISPVLEMPAPWALLVWGIRGRRGAVPRTTAVYVTKRAIATRFFDHHDRRLAPRITKCVVRCGGRRLRWNPAQQRKYYQHRSEILSWNASIPLDQHLSHRRTSSPASVEIPKRVWMDSHLRKVFGAAAALFGLGLAERRASAPLFKSGALAWQCVDSEGPVWVACSPDGLFATKPKEREGGTARSDRSHGARPATAALHRRLRNPATAQARRAGSLAGNGGRLPAMPGRTQRAQWFAQGFNTKIRVRCSTPQNSHRDRTQRGRSP